MAKGDVPEATRLSISILPANTEEPHNILLLFSGFYSFLVLIKQLRGIN